MPGKVMAQMNFLTVMLSAVTVLIKLEATCAINYRTNNKNSPRPHIVFILADDMGWNDVSFHGSDQIFTPNIDALAFNGVILNRHYAQPMCTPSRAALMTGKYPIHTGMQGSALFCSERRGLPLNEKILPQYLKDLGYATHIVGKWHLGYYKLDYTPLRRGFDSHLGYWNGAISYYDHIIQEVFNPEMNGHDFRANYTIARNYQGKYATDIFTEEAENLIANHDPASPMFLYLPQIAPHAGNPGKYLEAPQEIIDKYWFIPDPNRRTYAAMVHKLDESVGRVVTALERNNMLQNSIIVFMSDNGSPLSYLFQNYGSNYPFRGEKETLWEGGVHTPALVWSPLIAKNSRVSNHLMHLSDWLPTLFFAAGGNLAYLPENLNGFNMWPTITTDSPSLRHEVVVNIKPQYGSIIVEKAGGIYKLILGKPNPKLSNQYHRLLDLQLVPAYNPYNLLKSPAHYAISQLYKNKIGQRIPLNVLTIARLRNAAINKIHRRILRNISTINRLRNEAINEIGQRIPLKISTRVRNEAINKIRQRILLNTLTINRLRNEARNKIGQKIPLNILTINRLRNEATVKCRPVGKNESECSQCLFDLTRDPCEQVNLFSRPEYQGILASVINRYNAIKKTIVPELPKILDNNANPAFYNYNWVSWVK